MKKEMALIGPRERLENSGPSALADYELLAIVLRTGYQNSDVLTVSQTVLKEFETLYEFKSASLEELQQIKGIGLVKAIEIKAAQELGKRLESASQIKLGEVVSSENLGQMICAELKDFQQEHLMVVYLNNHHEMIKKEVVFIGSLTESVAHPREIFNLAVKCSAAKIVLAHNHPSGNLTPSKNDLAFTARLKSCGELMGIELLDHFIVSSQGYLSFREKSLLK
ncbi:JAB domain-containing protein [Vagococcus coleopterorum]|uniref:JAB domain-containing protein n=1 Tax=Vagococcus coleopterorum TaxID=2714946 RepID=A0A6G8APL6_9ENTE|nr:DNA repair protein RadC [Vagococcus coleopterorum]QIL46909.1 JAB domain-containing protein [Vagococcus coleopterorum]